MLSHHEIEIFLQHTPAPLQDIVFELRNIIAEVAPDAVEVIRWGGLSYFHKGRGGVVSASICQVAIFEDHIGLGLLHGAYLSDPHHLLEGTQKAKRYAWIWSYDEAPWDDLKQLIEESSQFDPRQLRLN
jgi:hypothetical protein